MKKRFSPQNDGKFIEITNPIMGNIETKVFIIPSFWKIYPYLNIKTTQERKNKKKTQVKIWKIFSYFARL